MKSRVPPGGSPRKSSITLLTDRELAALPDPSWVADQMIPESGLVAVVGAPGVGKTTFTVDLMMRVALGLPFSGRATTAGAVVYVAGEGVKGVKARVEAWKSLNGVTDVNSVFYVPEAVQLLNEQHVQEFLRTLSERGVAPRLVILDTLARCFEGGDENSADAMGRAIGAADRIVRQTGATVLLNHHTRKTGDVERGSSALRGALDAMIKLGEDRGVVTVSCEKMKDAEAFEDFQLRRVSVGSSCVLRAMDASTTVSNAKLMGGHLRVLGCLAEGALDGAALLESCGAPDTTARRWLRYVVEGGFVERCDDGSYDLTEAGADALRSEAGFRHHPQNLGDGDGGARAA